MAKLTQPVTVPCKWCGTPTFMTGTKMCNGCWELDHRIRYEPVIAQRILNYYYGNQQ